MAFSGQKTCIPKLNTYELRYLGKISPKKMGKIENLGNFGIDIWVESWYRLRLVKRQVRLLFLLAGEDLLCRNRHFCYPPGWHSGQQEDSGDER